MLAPTPTPASLVSDRWTIRPQRPADNESDYAAVMANREWLRRWSGSTWPTDDFTLAENLEDLAGHIDEHQRQEAYGFSVLAGDEVVGSLYVQSLRELLEDYAAPEDLLRRLDGRTLRADVWTRLDREPHLLADVVRAAHDWFAAAWGTSMIWCARIDCPELEDAYGRAGLELVTRLRRPDDGRVQLLFA